MAKNPSKAYGRSFCLLTVCVNLHVLLKLFILCKFGKKIVIKEFCFERQKELI